MDTYNNRVGIAIARANPNATPEELGALILQAVQAGRMVRIDPATGNLVPSGDRSI